MSKQPFQSTKENPISNPSRHKFYTRVADGGLNQCIKGYWQYGNGICSALTNCVGYCYGRALEAWGSSWDNRSWGVNGPWSWYYSSPSSYHIAKPTAGCVAAFTEHVLFVEKVYDDGLRWDYSESWWKSLKGGQPMYYQYVTGAPIGTYFGRERFGYIIPPNVQFQTIAQDDYYNFTSDVDSVRIPKMEWR